MPTETNILKNLLEDLVKATETKSTNDEFLRAFKSAVQTLSELKGQVTKEFDRSLTLLEDKVKDFGSKNTEDIKKEVQSLLKDARGQLSNLYKEQSDTLNFVKDKIREVKNGVTPSDEKLLSLIQPLIPVFELPIPETPQTLRDKLESLEEDERLKIEAVNNLREELDELKKEFKKVVYVGSSLLSPSHSPRHELFTMDGVATTVTLADAPGAQGKAAFVHYNGQFLADTTSYTVNGTQITFVGFTPELNTTVEVVYFP